MKIGIVSVAHMHAYSYAAYVLELAAEGVELVGIADEQEQRGKEAAQKFGCAYYRDYQALLGTDIDAVIVCTENVRHKEVVLAAAQAGKNVLCEKPIATTVSDAREMIDACERAGVILQTAFPVRFNRPIARLKTMIDHGQLGRILAIRGTNRGQNPGGWFVDLPMSGGGAVLDHTVHVVDIMRWYLQSEVREVYAEIDTRFNRMVADDCGLLMLEFENGVFASHDPSWSRCKTFPTWGDVTMEVVGTEGVVNLDAYAQHLLSYDDAAHRVQREFWGYDMDLGLVSDFVDCVKTKRKPSITGEDGLRAMEVALAAYESARTGRPVRIQHG